ncbi:hypothetical protein [Halomonas binhaiensis]|uniref:Exo-alpha-sialidase n=1 Tax=Halomonas binhaiensis TaxID=2562282 RepID=A0A5C1NH00_9GAMM|nr:hypothetical protein [Halomonas binhaiensis]QEM82546.1 hypothetical protein E4T21_14070 [Halomonas binhaiensis]
MKLRKVLLGFLAMALFFSILSGASMSLFNNDWEDTNLVNLDSVIQDKKERKAYSISEMILSGEEALIFGTKDKEYSGPVRLDQPSQIYFLSSQDSRINFLMSLDDNKQYTFGKHSNTVGDVIYATVNSRTLNQENQNMETALYKVKVPNGQFEELSIPEEADNIRLTPVFTNQEHGFLFPERRSVFFETQDGGRSWKVRHLPPGYARLKGSDRSRSGNITIQHETGDLFLSGHYREDDEKPSSSPIYRLPADNDDTQGWQEVTQLERYDINAMTFLDNGDLLILAFEGDRPEEGNDHRQAQILRWDGKDFEHLADLGNRELFDPRTNTNLSPNFFVSGRNGLVVLNGKSFKNEQGDLPVYNVSYVSHDYGKNWERIDNGIANGPVWFDKSSGYLYKATPFSFYRKRL